MLFRYTKQINVPEQVYPQLKDQCLLIEGPLGCLQIDLALFDPKGQMIVQIQKQPVHALQICSAHNKDPLQTVSSILQTCFKGVTQGFLSHIEAVGVGYKITVSDSHVSFRVGLSHPVSCALPPDVKVFLPKPTHLIVFGIDHQHVTQVVSQFKAIKFPEPYKGKGLRLKFEQVIRKEGKKK